MIWATINLDIHFANAEVGGIWAKKDTDLEINSFRKYFAFIAIVAMNKLL